MLDYHDITTPAECQITQSQTAIDVRKTLSRAMAARYRMTGLGYMQQRAAYMEACGDQMIVRRYDTADARAEIVYTQFCGVRLCPVCAHRRSLKAYWQLSRILDYCDAQRTQQRGSGYAYVLITLTMANVSPDALSEALQRYVDGCSRLFRSKPWREAIKGCWRSLEITYNREADTFHPHLHLYCAVNPSYFTDHSYISHDLLLRLWRRSAQLPYDPSVNIKRIKPNATGDARAEVSKYVTKQSNLLLDLPVLKSTELLVYLEDALNNRKQYITYGIFREAARALHLSDEDAQLLDPTDGDDQLAAQLRPDAAYLYQLIQYDDVTTSYKELDPFLPASEIDALPSMVRPLYRRFRGLQLAQLITSGAVQPSQLSEIDLHYVRIFGDDEARAAGKVEQVFDDNEQK